MSSYAVVSTDQGEAPDRRQSAAKDKCAGSAPMGSQAYFHPSELELKSIKKELVVK